VVVNVVVNITKSNNDFNISCCSKAKAFVQSQKLLLVKVFDVEYNEKVFINL